MSKWWPEDLRVWSYVRLVCPHCGHVECKSDYGYELDYVGQVVLIFDRHPGESYLPYQYSYHCDKCGKSYWPVKSVGDRSYNRILKEWEENPEFEAQIVKIVRK